MSEATPINPDASKKRKSFPWGWIVFAAVVLAPILYLVSIPMQIVHGADEGFRRAKKNIDPEQLRAWAFVMVKTHNGTNGYEDHVKRSEVPDYILNLYSEFPETVWVSPKLTDQDPLVVIIWGGGFFHWGIDVGTTNFSKRPFGDYQIAKWSSGIYYSHEGSAKIR